MINLIAIASAPVLLILLYVYYRDKYEKEPKWMLLLSFLGGIAIIPLAILWEGGMMKIMPSSNMKDYEAFYTAFAVAAVCEECLKYLAVMLIAYRSTHFNEKFDGIVYAVYVSMGFALVENILYVINGDTSVGLIRAITSVPAHAIFGISMGFYLGRAKFSGRKQIENLMYALIIPIILHGVYDFILMAQKRWLLIGFVLYLIILYYYGLKRMSDTSQQSVYKNQKQYD